MILLWATWGATQCKFESLTSLLCSKVVQPWPVALPLYVKVLIFSNMDQEMISLVCLWKSNEHLYWAFCSLRLRVFCSQSHHWHIPSVTKEQADVTEFPFQRWEHGAEEDLASCLNVATKQMTCKTSGGTHFPLPSFHLANLPIIIISIIIIPNIYQILQKR